MAFAAPGQGFSALSGPSAGGGPQIQKGPDLPEIQTESIGFQAISGEAKVQLLPEAWPEASLPEPTSSLFSVASGKGLVAAVGPTALVVATTDSVRDAFGAAGGDVKAFTPQLTIPMGTRISQLTFSSDGELLVISAELGGGLAFYETQALLNGTTQSAFELPTGGNSVRSLIPNPAPEAAGLFAVVTANGQLMMVDAKNRSFITGASGQILKEGVSCASWSTKGKQLVVGLGNGAATQMTPEGVVKAEIPRPPDLEGGHHVSSLMWLENDLFLAVYTPSGAGDTGMAPASLYYTIRRQPKTENFMAQLLPEVCAPFGLNRSPSFQFMQRLRDFAPDLKDAVIVSSTAAEDVGLFTRSSKPLTNDIPPEQILDTLATTTISDSRRAAVPMSEDMTTNTSVVGMALDLSSKTKVSRPIPGDEIEESPGPLPAIFILNHQGLLSGWWIIYNDSIRQGTTYSGLVVASGAQQPTPQAPAPSAFGAAPATVPTPSAFGQGSALGSGSFGAASALGGKTSPWGSRPTGTPSAGQPTFGQSTFGKPAFGATSAMGSSGPSTAFGSSGGLGPRPSPWGTSNQTPSSSGTAFGQTSAMGAQRASPFGALGSNQNTTPTAAPTIGTSGGFTSYASSGGFTSAASNTSGDALKQAPSTSLFAPSKDSGSIFGSKPDSNSSTNGILGSSKPSFSLTSSWTNPNAGKAEEPKPAEKGTSVFGGNFATALGSNLTETTPVSKEADMMEDEDEPVLPKQTDAPTAPASASTPQASNPFNTQKNLVSGGLFSNVPKATATPPKEESESVSKAQPESQKPTSTPLIPPIIKSEPTEDAGKVDENIPEAPLPPDTTSKASYTPGTSSASSVGAPKASFEEPPLPPDPFPSKPTTKPAFEYNDAPLPPDFTAKPIRSEQSTKPSKVEEVLEPSSPEKLSSEQQDEESERDEQEEEDQQLPESGSEDLDDEGSGIDVGQEMGSVGEPTPEPSPQSSFVLKTGGSSVGGSFEKIGPSREESSRSLFGEIGRSPIPALNPPQRIQQSPRSPSPVRQGVRNLLRPDASRSVSAPGVPLRPDGARKVTMGRPVQAASVYPPRFAEQSDREEREHQTQQKAKLQVEEEQGLSDREDEEIRKTLATEPEPTLRLDDFLAHQDYTSGVSKPGIPGQIEKVYRDVNSMLDTFGLNSRSVGGFVRGHEELSSSQGRSQADLEEDQAWTLAETEDLGAVVDALERDLLDGQLQDPETMLRECNGLSKELSRMKAKSNDIKHSINAKTDPQLLESLRTAPLTIEQSTIRHDLRAKYTEFQQTLGQTEEAISMLKAKLAGLQAMSSKANGASKVPTVEAVEKTILKMTSMFEKKSGDIDLLETQMRKLNVLGNSSGRSRSNSPFMTPPSHRRAPMTPGSSVNGRSFYTPGSRGSGLGASGSRLRASGKKLAAVADGEAQAYAAKAARKREVRVLLKEALNSGDPIVRSLDQL